MDGGQRAGNVDPEIPDQFSRVDASWITRRHGRAIAIADQHLDRAVAYAFPITPADAAGRVDVRAVARRLVRLEAAGVDSVGLLGSTRVYAYSTRSEKRRAIEAAVDTTGGRVPIIVSIGALRTDHAMILAKDAQAAGASGVLLAPRSYTPLTDQEAFQHFAAVADASNLPLSIYNHPATAHFSFSDELIERGAPYRCREESYPSACRGKAEVRDPARPSAGHFAAGTRKQRTRYMREALLDTAVPGLPSILVARGTVPAPGSCVANEGDVARVTKAYAIATGQLAAPGATLLIDANGWLRKVWANDRVPDDAALRSISAATAAHPLDASTATSPGGMPLNRKM